MQPLRARADAQDSGDELFRKADKINAELFTLTYGALVVQLIKDYEDYAEVNKQLDRASVPFSGVSVAFEAHHRDRGFNIGTRLIEDFLARASSTSAGASGPSSSIPKCNDFREVGETVSRVAFKCFLGISPAVSHNPQASGGLREFSLHLDDNPLAEFVELPEDALGKTQQHQVAQVTAANGNGFTPAGPGSMAGLSGPGRPGTNVAAALPGGVPAGPEGTSGGLWYSQILCGVVRGALEMVRPLAGPFTATWRLKSPRSGRHGRRGPLRERRAAWRRLDRDAGPVAQVSRRGGAAVR